MRLFEFQSTRLREARHALITLYNTDYRFQSTRLREARLINAKCTMINVSFNPRAYVRRDTRFFGIVL